MLQAGHVLSAQVVFFPLTLLTACVLISISQTGWQAGSVLASPSAGETCLCPISVRGNYGKCQYSQQNHISSEDAAGPSGCCIGHGHKREVCAQALGVFHRAGGTPAGLVVGSASSVVSAGVPPPVQG